MLMASLIIASAGLSAVLVINSSAKQSYASDQQFLIPNVSYTITAKSSKIKLNKSDYSNLRLLGFEQVIAIAQNTQHIYADEQRITQRRITFTGIDTFSLIGLPLFNKPIALSQQNTIERTDSPFQQMGFGGADAFLHPQLLSQLQNRAADTAGLETIDGRSIPALTPFDNASLGNDIIMDISSLYRLYPDSDLSMLIIVGELSRPDEEALRAALPNSLQLNTTNNEQQDSELTSSFHLNLMAMALLMFVVCLFIVVNAVSLLLNSRLPFLKICRQLGISRRQLFATQFIEVSFLTFVASALGVVLGIELAKLASPSVQATLENLYRVQVGFGQVSILGLMIQVFSICLVGSVCASFIPLNKLNYALSHSKDVPLTSKQHGFWRAITWLSFITLSTSAFLLLHQAQSLWLLLLATSLFILAGCSLLLVSYPAVLTLIQRLIPQRFPLLQVSSQQSLALSGKTKIACCAFFIAATSNIGMNLMVDSFRGATLGWLEQRLVADYYVYHNDKPSIDELAKETGVKVYQRYENYIEYQGKEIQQFSYPSDELHQRAMVFYDKGNAEITDKIRWQKYAREESVLVNQQFAFGFELAVNDQVVLPHPTSGELSTYIIAGIIYDFGSPYAQVLLPPSMFDAQKSTCCMFALTGSESQIDLLRENMKNAGFDPDIQLLNTQDLLAMSMQAFDNTFIITDGLNVVTLLVAALSLACAIIVLMNDIRPQNMLIRSMGVSAMKTQCLALFQYLLLCFVALVFATPFGILLSWILIFDINYQAFSWTYPLVVEPTKIIQIYASSLLIVSTIIAIPIIRAGRRPLIKDIRWIN